ncbi:tryptophanase [Streptomyces sp. NBC_01549]|uniref:tryptophanase n=1 Tax=Streptomyces sp. NBC_01549 TaxID=2975874 RepID=UPI002255C3A5|nr:tryptophanase [Streptomyces sp. NBC_01549]MCX4595934.1 tryptophanase [Streptomyces sp. NBC_01549]
MITSRTGGGPVSATQPLGGYVADQLLRLCQAMGLEPSDGEIYARVLTDCLGPVAERPLGEPPSYPSFLSDDHTPVEYSLAFVPDAPPTLRVLLEPGYGAEGLAENGRAGLRVVRDMAERWGFATDQLDRLEDLFFPPVPEGPLALWLALELRPGGVPKVKVYLNPAASGADRAAETVREALDRLGHRQAFAALPRADGYPFLALDLGDWETPRVKVYVTHRNLAAADAGELPRTDPGPRPETVREFLRVAAGLDSSAQHPGAAEGVRLEGRPVLSCHSFTESATGLPSGFTLHVPVRDYVRHDGEAYARAVAVLRRHGMDTAALDRSLATVTSRLLHDGVGLIAYLALVHERGRPPRVTAYISSEAYEVRPPVRAQSPHQTFFPHRAAGTEPRETLHSVGNGKAGAEIRMEPYRIKVVEPIPLTTPQQRKAAVERVHYNLFDLRAEEVTIDLLSDSGTGALSAAQLAVGMAGDESYAGSRSFYRFRDTVTELTGYSHILPAHQGRAAERLLFSNLLKPGDTVLSNTHFDTTRANVELAGCVARDLPCAEARDLDSLEPFKGNIDLEALERGLTETTGSRVAAVVMTITNNGGGGQPVSMENLRRTSELCRRHGVPLILDAARFAENAWLVTRHEAAYKDRTPRQVAEEAFRLADGCVMSAKKDGIVHIGGFIGLNDPELAQKCQLLLIATEGFPTYGGLAGRDLDMIAQGLQEVTEPSYLAERAEIADHLAQRVRAAGVDILEPPGLHAIYLNAGRLLPHIPPHQYPGHALACRLYLEGGIRSAELGSLYLGEEDEDGNPVKSPPYELVRLALPRRVYTRSHYDHVGRTLETIAKNADSVHGYRIVEQSPILRHFSAKLQPVTV